MRLRELWNPRRETPPASEDGDGGAPEVDRLRGAGEELLRAGDEAIRRALSGDSQGFLRANRQTGGE